MTTPTNKNVARIANETAVADLLTRSENYDTAKWLGEVARNRPAQFESALSLALGVALPRNPKGAAGTAER